jgi:hypothetical protein
MKGRRAVRKIIGGLILLLLLAPLVVLPIWASKIKAQSSPCKATRRIRTHNSASAAPPARSKSSATKNQMPALNLKQGESTVLAFGRALETKRQDIWLDLTGTVPSPSKGLRVYVGDFTRDDGARISSGSLRANAKVFGNQVRMRVCMERTDSHTANPGTYQGRITVLDPRVQTYTVPITITLAYPLWPLPTLILYLVVLIAIPYVWGLKQALDDHDGVFTAKSWRSFRTWAASWGGIVSIGVGIAGAIAAFTASYLTSPDWGSGFPQVLGLFGAVFTAFVTAATAARGAAEIRAPDAAKDGPQQAT